MELAKTLPLLSRLMLAEKLPHPRPGTTIDVQTTAFSKACTRIDFMATRRHVITAARCTLLASPSTNADIYRWDTGEVIPGTEGIEPGPGVRLVGGIPMIATFGMRTSLEDSI